MTKGKFVNICFNNGLDFAYIVVGNDKMQYRKLMDNNYSLEINGEKSYAKHEHKNIDADMVYTLCLNYLGIKRESLETKVRHSEIVYNRQLIHYVMRELVYQNKIKISLAEIGGLVGGKDHSTVLHSHKTIRNYLDTAYKNTIGTVEGLMELFI